MATIQLTRDDIEPIVRHVLEVADRFEPAQISYRHLDAARAIGMDEQQLKAFRAAGIIPARKLGKFWYYTREDLISLVTQHEMSTERVTA
jgi:hypothetical protein